MKLISLLIVLLFIAPALLERGAEMRQSVRGPTSARWGRWGGGVGVRVEWRIRAWEAL